MSYLDESEDTGTRAFTYIVGIGGALIGAAVVRFAFGYFDNSPSEELEKGFALAAAEIRSQAPIQVDEITKLMGAVSVKNQIIYSMRIEGDIPVGELEATRIAIQDLNQRNLCNDSDASKALDAGGIMVHQYTDNSGNQFKTTVSDCP